MHVDDRPAARQGTGAAVAAHRRLLVSARRHADRRVLADRCAAQGAVAARPGRADVSRTLMARTPPVPKGPPKRAKPPALRDAIRAEALRLGFDAVGFAPAKTAPEARRTRLQQLGSFVEKGFQGDMGWLGERSE